MLIRWSGRGKRQTVPATRDALQSVAMPANHDSPDTLASRPETTRDRPESSGHHCGLEVLDRPPSVLYTHRDRPPTEPWWTG